MQLWIHRVGFTDVTVESKRVRFSHVRRLARYAASLTLMAASAVHAAPGVVPERGKGSSVTTSNNGHQTVSIGPPAYGLSRNVYSNFSFTKTSATLDHANANARTITKQATSTDPSLIDGGVTVLGSRTNVVLSNLNGTTVPLAAAPLLT